MKYLNLLLPTLGIVALPTAALAQYPIIFNHVKYASMPQAACTRRAEVAVKKAGFDRNFEPLASGAFGANGNYSVSVRCEMRAGIVFFAVAGPDNATSSNLVERVQSEF